MDKQTAKLIDRLLSRVINQAGLIAQLRRQQATSRLTIELDALERAGVSTTRSPSDVMCQGRMTTDGTMDCPLDVEADDKQIETET